MMKRPSKKTSKSDSASSTLIDAATNDQRQREMQQRQREMQQRQTAIAYDALSKRIVGALYIESEIMKETLAAREREVAELQHRVEALTRPSAAGTENLTSPEVTPV